MAASVILESPPSFNNLPLGYYGEKVRQIGQGGYGKVWLTDQNYVIKEIIYRYNIISKDILSEIVYPSSIQHPGIIKYQDVYLFPDRVSLIMEKYDGDLLRFKVPNRDIFRSIAFQLISTVAYLSSRNILHRDIKPDNILYRRCPGGYQCVLADFGLSTGKECIYTPNSWNVYTIWYRPPEVLMEQRDYDIQSDVWALGVTLYYIFTGRRLFRGDNPLQMLQSIADKIIHPEGFTRRVDRLNPKQLYRLFHNQRENLVLVSDPEVNDLLIQMLTPDPGQRSSIFDLQTHPLFKDLDVGCYSIQTTLGNTCPNRLQLFDRSFDFTKLPVAYSYHGTIVKWMNDFTNKNKINDAAYYLALEMWYRYMYLTPDIPPDFYQLIAAASLFIGSTMWDHHAIRIEKLVTSLPDIYTDTVIMEKVEDILEVLNYDLLATTKYDQLVANHSQYTFSETQQLVGLLNACSLEHALYSNPNIVNFCKNIVDSVDEIDTSLWDLLSSSFAKNYEFRKIILSVEELNPVSDKLSEEMYRWFHIY